MFVIFKNIALSDINFKNFLLKGMTFTVKPVLRGHDLRDKEKLVL